jgi:hypothetical protein
MSYCLNVLHNEIALLEMATTDDESSHPRIDQMAAKASHVQEPRRDGNDRKYDMGQVPYLVTDLQLRAPQGHNDQCDQRVYRQSAKAGALRGL